MKQHLLIMVVVGSMFLSSCATVLNDNFTSININTSDKSQIVLKTDTLQTDILQTVDNFITLTVPRSEKPLNITIQSDSLKKVITIDPKYSFSYYLNLIYNCGIGLFIENHFPKSFTYPSNIYINTTTDTLNQYYQYYSPPKEGKLDFHISLPHINSFYLHPTDENYKQKTGFWGISLGVDYYHTSKQFVNLSMSALTDFFLPIPAAVDIYGEHEMMSTIYGSVTNNHKIDDFSFGYGLSYGRNNWSYKDFGRTDTIIPLRESKYKSHLSAGLLLSTYYQLGYYFNIGLVYRPTFVKFESNNTLLYEHSISVDFAWKIPLL